MQPSGISATELGAFGAADPVQLSNFAGVVDNLVSIRDAEMQALSTALHRLSLENVRVIFFKFSLCLLFLLASSSHCDHSVFKSAVSTAGHVHE